MYGVVKTIDRSLEIIDGTMYHIGIEEVREIDETVNRLKSTFGTSVFHGRDLFGYCAARLASGIIKE